LQARDPKLRFRARFRESALFTKTTLQDLLDSPSGLEGFLRECRRCPDCGPQCSDTLKRVLSEEIGRHRMTTPDAPKMPSGGRSPELQNDSQTGNVMYPAEWRSFVGTLCPDTVVGIQDVFLRYWRAAHFSTFVYLPISLPEFLKIPAVLSAELGAHRDLTEYVQRMTALRRSLELTKQASGNVLLDSQAISAILDRQGRYTELGASDVSEQMAVLLEFASNLPNGIECLVVDFERSRLSCGAVVGEDVVVYAMGAYVLVRDSGVRDIILARCDAARSDAETLVGFLKPWLTCRDGSPD
jgi:hypothetical protein